MDAVSKILIISSDEKLKDTLNFCFDGWGYEVFLGDVSVKYDLDVIKRISPDAIIIDVQSARKEDLDFCQILKNDFGTTFIPLITLINKRQLRSQLLSLKQGIDDYLIKPPDPLDLRVRIEIATRRARHSIYANSLTGLPGGKMLEEILNEKLKTKSEFSFCYLDVDNFKSFNDVYGYLKGDKVILQTAHMLTTVLKKLGNKTDFVSHIGGDDFAFITTPGKYEQICHHFIQMFDNIIPFHYSLDDRKQGYLVTHDRTRKINRIPLMSVSIAVVNVDGSYNFKNTIEVNEKIAEIKRYLKSLPESKFMPDRRSAKSMAANFPHVHKKDNDQSLYQPLGQILLEGKTITYEQLEEALSIHWQRGIALGEVLKDLGFLSDERLKEALAAQKVNFSYTVIENSN